MKTLSVSTKGLAARVARVRPLLSAAASAPPAALSARAPLLVACSSSPAHLRRTGAGVDSRFFPQAKSARSQLPSSGDELSITPRPTRPTAPSSTTAPPTTRTPPKSRTSCCSRARRRRTASSFSRATRRPSTSTSTTRACGPGRTTCYFTSSRRGASPRRLRTLRRLSAPRASRRATSSAPHRRHVPPRPGDRIAPDAAAPGRVRRAGWSRR